MEKIINRKFHLALVIYLLVLFCYSCYGIIYGLVCDAEFLLAKIATVIYSASILTGSVLLLRMKKIGYYTLIGTFIILMIIVIIVYGIMNYHMKGFTGTFSWVFGTCLTIINILILQFLVRLKKNGKKAIDLLK